MIAYFDKIVNTLSRPRTILLLANVFLVFLLICFSNLGILPIHKVSDFIFFAIIGLIFALYRPGWAFLLFVGTIALENINLAPEALGISIRPFQFIGGIVFLAVLARIAFKRSSFDIPKFSLADWAVAIFALAGFLSSVSALDRGVSFKQSLIALTFALLYFLTRVFIQNLADLKKIIPFFLSSGVVMTFYGIWQNVRFNQKLAHFETMPGRPNATFTEADWLGIYLVLLIAVVYAMIYYFYNTHDNRDSLISNEEFLTRLPDGQVSNQFSISKFSNLLVTSYWLLVTLTYVLLILTVSRSAWLGALAVTISFLFLALTNFKINFSQWHWKKFFHILQFTAAALICSIALVYFFNLTTFQLWNRAGSTTSGLQKITVSCKKDVALPEKIETVQELENYDCRHIDLENRDRERELGFVIREIDRPDPNVNIRAQIYQKSWETIKNNPIWGIGWGNSSLILGKDERGVSLNSSNIFLETWLGSGILGMLSLVFIFGYVIIQSLINFAKNNNDEAKISGLFVLLGSIALLIPNLFNAGIFLGILWLFLGIAVGTSNNAWSKF